MAALDIVYDQLRKLGLDDICLDLYSPAASKRHVTESLDCTLQAAAGASETRPVKQLTASDDRLNYAAKCLHTQIGDTAMTPYRMLSIQIAAARRGFTPDPRLVEEAALWTGEEFAGKARLIERLARLTETIGPLNSHLYAGVRRRSALKPADLQRHIPKLQALAGKVAALAAYATMVTNYFGLPSDPTLAGVKTLIAIFRAISYLPPGAGNIAAAIAMHPSPRNLADGTAPGTKWLEQQAPYLHTFHPAAWAGLVGGLRAPLAQGAPFWLARAGKAYRKSAAALASLLSAPLPKQPDGRLALLDAVLASQASRRKFAAEAGLLATLLSDVWQEKRAVLRQIHEVARTAGELAAFDPNLNAELVIGAARDVTAEAHCDYLEAGLDEVVNAFAATIKFFDLDLAAVFQTDSIATIDLNRLSAWAAGWAASHFILRNGEVSSWPIEKCARPGLPGSPAPLAPESSIPTMHLWKSKPHLPKPAGKGRSRPTQNSPPSAAGGARSLSRYSPRSRKGRARPPCAVFARAIRRRSRASAPWAKCV